MRNLKMILFGTALIALGSVGFMNFSANVNAQSSSTECQYDSDGCVNPKVINTCGCEIDDEKPN